MLAKNVDRGLLSGIAVCWVLSEKLELDYSRQLLSTNWREGPQWRLQSANQQMFSLQHPDKKQSCSQQNSLFFITMQIMQSVSTRVIVTSLQRGFSVVLSCYWRLKNQLVTLSLMKGSLPTCDINRKCYFFPLSHVVIVSMPTTWFRLGYLFCSSSQMCSCALKARLLLMWADTLCQK